MDPLPICEGGQVIVPAHQFADSAPEIGIYSQKTLDLRCRIFVRAVKSAAKRMKPLLHFFRLRQQFMGQNMVRPGVKVAPAVIAQVISGLIFHQVIPFFDHRHSENNGLRYATQVHGSNQSRKSVGILREVQKMKMGIQDIVSGDCFRFIYRYLFVVDNKPVS